jgi:hypothetical protein
LEVRAHCCCSFLAVSVCASVYVCVPVCVHARVCVSVCVSVWEEHCMCLLPKAPLEPSTQSIGCSGLR